MPSTALRIVRIAAWVAIGIVVGVVGWTFLAPKAQNPAQSVAAASVGGPFSLTDQRGTTVTDASLKGHASAVFFGYTFCPDICPTTLASLSVWLQQLGPLGDRLHAYFVTIDPERDTQQVLAEYMQAFDPRIEALTGTPAAIDEMVKNYRVYVHRVGDGPSYTFDHTATVLLFDSNGKLTGTISNDEDPAVAFEKIRRLVGIAIS